MTFYNMLEKLVAADGADQHIAIRVLDGLSPVVFERCYSLAALILLAGDNGLVMIPDIILRHHPVTVLDFFVGDMVFAILLL